MATQSLAGPDGSRLETTRKGVEYLVRPYEDGDAPGVVSLLATQQFSQLDEDWFRRTYLENPYVDHVPLFVVESDGEIVGIRPFTAFRIRAGDDRLLALLTRDTLVHPDHRRRGLFTAMTELALDHYESAEPAFLFSHSNSKSLPGYRKMGWSALGQREVYSRVQRAEELVDGRTRESVGRLLSPVAGRLAPVYLGSRDRLSTVPADVTVTRHESVPAETLASLYRRRRPDRPHVVRDEAFYRWRYRNPEWQPNTTFVARRDGDPVAAAVAVARDRARAITSIGDVVPRTGGDAWTSGLRSVLDAVVADNDDAGEVRCPDPVFPRRVLRARGFLSWRRLPLSALVDGTRRLTLGVRTFDDGEETIGGYPATDAATELWSLAH